MCHAAIGEHMLSVAALDAALRLAKTGNLMYSEALTVREHALAGKGVASAAARGSGSDLHWSKEQRDGEAAAGGDDGADAPGGRQQGVVRGALALVGLGRGAHRGKQQGAQFLPGLRHGRSQAALQQQQATAAVHIFLGVSRIDNAKGRKEKANAQRTRTCFIWPGNLVLDVRFRAFFQSRFFCFSYRETPENAKKKPTRDKGKEFDARPRPRNKNKLLRF
jgi:hypothetical protein